MLHILLLILKIIGIILLVLLGLLLLAVCCVLFVPVRYRFDVRYYEDIQVRAGVSWLMHIISVQAQYTKDLHFVIKIFGITFFDNQRPKKPKKPETVNTVKGTSKEETETKKIASKEIAAKETVTKEIASKETTAKETVTEESSESPPQIPNEKDLDVHTIDIHRNTSAETETNLTSQQDSAAKSAADTILQNPDKKLSFFEKLRLKITAVFEKIKAIRQSVNNKIASLKVTRDNIVKKVQNIAAKKDAVLTILYDKKNQQSFRKVKALAIKLLKHIQPRRFQARLWFGFEDPSATGLTLGVLSMLYPIYTSHIELYPDFEKKLFQGECSGRGRIQAFVFLKAACSLILDKNIRRIITSFKNI